MKRSLFLLILLAMLLSACNYASALPQPVPPPVEDQAQQPVAEQVPVLLYHHLTPEPEANNPMVVTVAEFREQMQALKAAGRQPITTAELAAWLSNERHLPAKPVLITFDDGYRSNWEHAYPVLQELGLKATLFLVTSKVGKQPGKYPYVTWSDLYDMQESQVFEIQAHSHDGHREIEGKPALLTWDAATLQQDLATLQTEMTSHQLRACTAYAYPYGAHNEEIIATLAEAGLKLGFTGEQGLITKGDHPFRLKRLSVLPGTSPCALVGRVTGSSQECAQQTDPVSR